MAKKKYTEEVVETDEGLTITKHIEENDSYLGNDDNTFVEIRSGATAVKLNVFNGSNAESLFDEIVNCVSKFVISEG